MTTFYQRTPTLDSYWRAIILFGMNVACYKFALGKTLLEKIKQDATKLTLEDLAVPFSDHVCQHLRLADRQLTRSSSKFLESCRKFNLGEINKDKLIETAVSVGFRNVIDAFHIVNRGEVGVRFFTDERSHGGGIHLTDDIFRLRETLQGCSLEHEVEARWRLVETAWSLNLSRNLVAVEAGNGGQTLFVSGKRRVTLTSSRDALNGYQKGRCFYCFDEISVSPKHQRLAEVDHFFPWTLRNSDVDGVWNLVLACHDCNGARGKSARVPTRRLLERLHYRNNHLIESHHPLRSTLIHQTGGNESERRSFLQRRFDEAVTKLLHTWEPLPQASSIF